MPVAFCLEGSEFVALHGGQHFTITPAILFVVNCETHSDVDELWKKLSAGGDIGRFGWRRSRFGESSQIFSPVRSEMLNDPDPQKAERAMKALLQMKKFEIQKLLAD